MEVGDKFTHKYSPTITCEITGFTDKGYKVQQTEGKKKPKQAFFDKPDFDVKNGFWVKISTSLSNVDGLKYQTFEDFLERISINNIPKRKDAEMLDLQLPNYSRHYFYSNLSIDGIEVRIVWSKYNPGKCSIKVQGIIEKDFRVDSYDVVMNDSMKWLYDNYFRFDKNEKASFRTYYQGYLDFDYYKFSQYFTYIRTYHQSNYDEVVIDLAKKGFEMETIFIEKIIYHYASFKDELLNIDL